MVKNTLSLTPFGIFTFTSDFTLYQSFLRICSFLYYFFLNSNMHWVFDQLLHMWQSVFQAVREDITDKYPLVLKSLQSDQFFWAKQIAQFLLINQQKHLASLKNTGNPTVQPAPRSLGKGVLSSKGEQLLLLVMLQLLDHILKNCLAFCFLNSWSEYNS